MDSLRFKVNQRPVHAVRQLGRPQDYSEGFQSLLLPERLQGGKVNLASHQMSVLFGFNLSARTQTGSLSIPVQMSEAVTLCFYWLRGGDGGSCLPHFWLAAQTAAAWSATVGRWCRVFCMFFNHLRCSPRMYTHARSPHKAHRSKCVIQARADAEGNFTKRGIYRMSKLDSR